MVHGTLWERGAVFFFYPVDTFFFYFFLSFYFHSLLLSALALSFERSGKLPHWNASSRLSIYFTTFFLFKRNQEYLGCQCDYLWILYITYDAFFLFFSKLSRTLHGAGWVDYVGSMTHVDRRCLILPRAGKILHRESCFRVNIYPCFHSASVSNITTTTIIIIIIMIIMIMIMVIIKYSLSTNL